MCASLERWPSGRRRSPAKGVWALKAHRGFESLSLRQRDNAPVAQLDRVPGYEPGGREFESLRARQLKITTLWVVFFCFYVLFSMLQTKSKTLNNKQALFFSKNKYNLLKIYRTYLSY